MIRRLWRWIRSAGRDGDGAPAGQDGVTVTAGFIQDLIDRQETMQERLDRLERAGDGPAPGNETEEPPTDRDATEPELKGYE